MTDKVTGLTTISSMSNTVSEEFRNAVAMEFYNGRWTVYDWVPRYANQKWFNTKEEAEAYIQSGCGRRCSVSC